MDKVTQLKSEIFDILREQDGLKIQLQQKEQEKQQKLQELQKVEESADTD